VGDEVDFQFRSSPISNPSVLSINQVRRFNRDGFLSPVSILAPDPMSEIREYFDTLLGRYLEAGHDQYSIASAHTRHGRVWDLLTHPDIVAVARDLLGPNVVGMGAHFWCKLPGDGKTVAWHQDAAYWLIRPSTAITVWLALDPADRENGCMKFISGSHLLGHLASTPAKDEDASVLPAKVEKAESLGSVVHAELRPGEASIHSDLVLHASDRNNSTRRRCGLALRYTAGFAVPPERFRQAGVWVAGNMLGDWANLPRPQAD